MKLYVMRHGSAEDESADGRDATRALTNVGRDRTRHVAKKLAELGEAPKVIVSSPLVRALQTAEIVYGQLELSTPVEANTAIAPRGDAAHFVREAAKAGRKRLMVVGHEPDLSILVATLIGEPLETPFMKSMVVSVRVPPDGGDAVLRFVLDPKSLELLVDQRVSTPPS